MSQSLRPQSVKLRKVQSQRGPQDIGSAHVLDYWLHRACREYRELGAMLKARHSQIGRYLDGEEEREGTYR
jgi:hypothetical protein